MTQDPPPGLQGLPQTPVLPGADPDAKLDKVLHSLDALTTFIKSEVVTRTHLDKYHQEQLEMIDKRVVQATEPLLMEIAGLKDRLGAVEANRFDIGSGGARNRSASERPRATDPAFKTIVFKGIPVNMSADERLNAIDGFMKQHFSGVRVRDVGNFYKGAFPNGRSLTRAAYVELSNADVRREVLEKIGGVKGQPAKIKCFLGGVEVRVRKALTEQAIQRNSALRRAADAIKEDGRFTGKTPKIEWVGERGVTVDGSFVFTQGQADVVGKFVEKYADMTLPGR